MFPKSRIKYYYYSVSVGGYLIKGVKSAEKESLKKKKKEHCEVKKNL